MDVLIDKQGNICPIGSGVVRQSDDQTLSDALLPDDLVRNHGYIRFRIGVRDPGLLIFLLNGIQHVDQAFNSAVDIVELIEAKQSETEC